MASVREIAVETRLYVSGSTDSIDRSRRSMNIPDAIDTLEYFEEKAAHLQQLSAASQVMKRLGAVVEWKRGQGWDGVFVGPEGEPVEALVLTLRFFIIDNEPVSLRNMRKLYSSLTLSADLVARFQEQCEELNGFLDTDTNISIEETKKLTYRDVFLLFLYGFLAHGNDSAKRRAFRDLREGVFFPFLQMYFAETIRGFVIAINVLRKINQEALDELRDSMPGQEANAV